MEQHLEHRLEPRVEMPLPLVVRDRHGHRFRCTTRNASAGGLFIDIDAESTAIREHAVIEVALEAADGEAHWLDGDTAYVVHRQPDGVGVMFTALDSPTRNAVRRRLGTHARAS